MSAMASQITGVSIVCSKVCSDTDQRKHQSSASLAFVSGNHRWPVDSPHKGPVTRKMFPFDDVRNTTVCIFRGKHWRLIDLALTGQGWGLLKLRSLISPWAKYSISQKCPLGSLNHIHIWQVSPQLGCGDTWQIWTWYSIHNVCFDIVENIS